MRAQQFKTFLLLTVLGSILGLAVWGHGGGDFIPWNWCLVALGATGAAYLAFFRRREHAPRIDRQAGLCIALLLAFVVLQLLPLPLAILTVLSPARAALTRALDVLQPQSTASLSIMPQRTWMYLLRLCAFVLLYLLVRETAWRLRERLWLGTVPLFGVAIAEAAIGLGQMQSVTGAVGTYLNRDLYGGLVAMISPFPVLLLGLTIARRRAVPQPVFFARIAGCMLVLLPILSALTRSLSRMAVASAVIGILVAMILFATRSGLRVAGMLAAVVAAGLLALAPQALFTRYADLNKPGQTDANRLPIWKETLSVVAAYPITGCGLGCRKSAYLTHKESNSQFATDYSHNDYLQALAELGIPGFLIALAAAGCLFREVIRAARTRTDPTARSLALACVAAMTALAIHSLADFNLHQPSNMLVMAWIAGLGSATTVAPVRRERSSDAIIDLVKVE